MASPSKAGRQIRHSNHNRVWRSFHGRDHCRGRQVASREDRAADDGLQEALTEAGGDQEKAIEVLRKAGAEDGREAGGRETTPAGSRVYTDVEGGRRRDGRAAVRKRPVASNEEFIQLANDLAKQLATGPGANTPDELLAQPSPSQARQHAASSSSRTLTTGSARSSRSSGSCGSTRPAAATPITTARRACSCRSRAAIAELAKDICMHVAAMRPTARRPRKTSIRRCRQGARDPHRAGPQEGKPENIIEKMVEGRLRTSTPSDA